MLEGASGDITNVSNYMFAGIGQDEPQNIFLEPSSNILEEQLVLLITKTSFQLQNIQL